MKRPNAAARAKWQRGGSSVKVSTKGGGPYPLFQLFKGRVTPFPEFFNEDFCDVIFHFSLTDCFFYLRLSSAFNFSMSKDVSISSDATCEFYKNKRKIHFFGL